MNELPFLVFLVCALALGGTLYYLGVWFEDRRTRRDYQNARKEFHAAIDRGEKRETAPVYCDRVGKLSVEFHDIVRTERFRRQLAALKQIRIASEKQNRR